MKEVKRYSPAVRNACCGRMHEVASSLSGTSDVYVLAEEFDSTVKELEGRLKVAVEAFTSLSRGWYFDEDGIVQPVEDPGAFAEGALAQIEGK